jgi:formate dehydrogenase subunit gamma
VQPGNNAPMWRQVGAGATGFSSLPHSQAPEAGNLIQPFVQYPGSSLTNAGEAWRQVRNNWILPYGGSLLLIVLFAIGIFYKTKGPLGGHIPDTGRKIERFTPFERAAHWANAGAFHCAWRCRASSWHLASISSCRSLAARCLAGCLRAEKPAQLCRPVVCRVLS